MKKGILLLLGLVLLAGVVGAQGEVCGVYFTYEHCSNCAHTDPLVLKEWLRENEGLVIVEYFFPSWTDDNAYLLGLYAQEYGSNAAVPNLFLGSEKNYVGRIEVQEAKLEIDSLEENDCLLLEKSVAFEELDFSELGGSPKIWAGDRVLVRTGEGNVDSNFLRQLLFSDDLETLVVESDYEIFGIEPEPQLISGGHIEFENALEVENSWVLQYGGEKVLEPSNGEERNGTIDIPLIGEVNPNEGSLFFITLMIGLADGFNPCAFFILTFLLTAMIMAVGEEKDFSKKRGRILLVGGIFVVFSGVIYFLFMGLWLNVFLYAKQILMLTMLAGFIAVFAGFVNIKDYFAFQRGLSFTLPKSEKGKFMSKVEKLKDVKSIWALLIGTVIVAVSVNMYELLCTFGFPMVYLGALAARELNSVSYYGYIALYNLFYVLPLLVIVLVSAFTLGAKEFSKKNVQRLKLISGFMALFLGGVLIFRPGLLENFLTAFGTLFGAIVVSLTVMKVWPLGEKEG